MLHVKLPKLIFILLLGCCCKLVECHKIVTFSLFRQLVVFFYSQVVAFINLKTINELIILELLLILRTPVTKLGLNICLVGCIVQ